MKQFSCFHACLFLIVIGLLGSCKKSTDVDDLVPVQRDSDSLAATISSPLAINVYPVVTNNGAGVGRIFIKTIQVGNISITIPLLFDTGSAGVTLNALSIFPVTLVDQNGFKFKSGQDTIQYQGITITKVTVQKIYGSAGAVETRQIGNIGYCKLAVGDASGALRMLKMPILFYFQTLANGIPTTSGLGPVFGINTTYNDSQGIPDSTYIFKQISPLKYLIYAGSLTPGYKLSAITLNGCDINTPGSCMPQALLTVGLTPSDETNYALNNLAALSPQPVLTPVAGFTGYPAYTMYNPSILNSVISTAARSRTVSVLLDSGNPGVILNVYKDSLNVASYPIITLTTPSKSVYTYNYTTANFSTLFNPSSSRSVYGIYFFTKYNFLQDYKNGLIGLKAN